ncbi:hypothetical protein D3C87_1350650 [compost metagenome]
MAAEGLHGPCQRRVGVGRRRALGIQGPPQGNGLLLAGMQLDIATGDGTGGEIEHEGFFPVRAGPGECQRVGAEHAFAAAFRRDPGMAWGHGHAHQPVPGNGFDFGPERRKMKAVTDYQCSNALLSRLFDQRRQAGLEGQLRIALVRIDFHDRWSRLGQSRPCRRGDLARAQ